MRALAECQLYGIIDLGYVAIDDAARMAEYLIEGGIDLLQLRAKHAAPEQIVTLGRHLHAISSSSNVPLIINDFPELVPAIGAEGAHIGQDDGPLPEARHAAGAGKWIGRSTHSVDQAQAAFQEGADYIGFGPLFATPTKPDYPAIGLEHIREVVAQAPVPVFCIGGVKLANLAEIRAAGADRVVIVSGLLQAEDPVAATAKAREALGRLEREGE